MSAKQEFLQEYYVQCLQAWGGSQKTIDEIRREKNTERAKTQPFEKGREPQKVGVVVRNFLQHSGFIKHMANTAVVTNWTKIVGANVAQHTTVRGFVNGRLLVECDSTAWATQLRLLSTTIVSQIKKEYPDTQITAVEVKAPQTIVWRHGPRVVPGRGPRDTYG